MDTNDQTMNSNGVYVDWKGKPCKHKQHGGMRAVVFILGIQAFEIMAIAAVGNNLITYVFNEMHFSLSKSANSVTNFVGTIFLMSLLGGFLSDSYLGSLRTMLVFGFVELSGLVLLSVQAHFPQLRPAKCNMMSKQEHCLEATGLKATIFFIALYLVAIGSGCLKPNMISHGADQFAKEDESQSKKLSTYFNMAYFSFCVGELIALTVLVWVQTRLGMDVGFAVSAATMAVGLFCVFSGTLLYRNKPPQGSIFTPIARVFVAAFTKRKQVCPSNTELLQQKQMFAKDHSDTSSQPHLRIANLQHIGKFRFLDKACIKSKDDSRAKETSWRLCTITEVEQVKTILSVIPIFACTIIFNTVLAQLQTFSVQQGSVMNTSISYSFKIPPASLQAIPYLMLILLVPLYETVFVPLAKRLTGNDAGITPLQRIGFGLFAVAFSMVSAALVEHKRRETAIESNKQISILWIAPQFLIFGLSEMFTAVGLIEFFYKQSLVGMQSFLTAITYCSYSFGFFLSSLLVSLVNKITSTKHSSSSSKLCGWLSDNDLNKDRLDLFYWFMATLSLLNFVNYLYWSTWYTKSTTIGTKATNDDYEEEKLSSNTNLV